MAVFQRSQLTRMAAALSYRTIFGLIPMLVVGLVLLTAYSSKEDRREVITQLLTFAGISQIVVEPGTDPTPSDPTPSNPTPSNPTPSTSAATDAVAALPGQPSAHSPGPAATQSAASPAPSASIPIDQPTGLAGASATGAARLDDWITQIVDRVGEIQFGAIGIIGLLTLIYAAISMMVEIEQAFNSICNAPQGRSWTRRITLYWTLMTLGTVFLVGSFAAGESIRAFTEALSQREAFSFLRGTLMSVLGFGVTWVISTLLLLIVYLTVPNTRLQVGPALLGAAIGAILWESGKWGFTTYVHYSAGYSRLYGSLALIPLFLLWVYVTWLIVLFGLQLAYATQSYRVAQKQGLTHALLVSLGVADDPRPMRSGRFVDPAIALGVLARVADRFARGKPCDPNLVAADLALDDASAAEMLERLAGAGYVHRVGDDNAYTLARPAHAIDAAEVLTLAHAWSSGGSTVPGALLAPAKGPPFLESLARARLDALRGTTLASLMDTPPATPRATPRATLPAASTQPATALPIADPSTTSPATSQAQAAPRTATTAAPDPHTAPA
jgi:membrane protein